MVNRAQRRCSIPFFAYPDHDVTIARLTAFAPLHNGDHTVDVCRKGMAYLTAGR